MKKGRYTHTRRGEDTVKVFAVLVLTCMITGPGCEDLVATQPAHPDWVYNLIDEFAAAPVGDPPQSIWQYQYKGNTVYFVPPQCCDQYSELYDDTGIIIAHPDGGIAGNGDGRCPDFFKERSAEVLVWKDHRTR